jgi:hypothetical protein
VLLSSGDSFPHLIQKPRSQLGFVTYLLNHPLKFCIYFPPPSLRLHTRVNLLSLAERTYKPSVTTKCIPVYYLLHVSAFLKCQHQTITIHEESKLITTCYDTFQIAEVSTLQNVKLCKPQLYKNSRLRTKILKYNKCILY